MKTTNHYTDLEHLELVARRIADSGADITREYADWISVTFGCASLGEGARESYHLICSQYAGYKREECDKCFDNCMRTGRGDITLGTVLKLAQDAGIDTSLPRGRRPKSARQSQEEKKAELAQNQEVIDDRRQALEVKKGELDEIMEETRSEEEKLKAKVKELEIKIEPRLLTSFKRIRKNARNGLGIVYVQRDACGGCFNKIPPQRQLDIKMHKKVIVCEYCGRILIDPELAGVKIVPTGVEEKKPRKRAIRKSVKKADDTPDVPELEA
jgi:hypothetical protein